jgi:hypothetical protein
MTIVFQPYSPENTGNAAELAHVMSDAGIISIERHAPVAEGNMRGVFTYTVNSTRSGCIEVEFHFDGKEEFEETLDAVSTWETARLISNYYPIHGEHLYIEDTGSVNISDCISTLTGGQY